jgi:hypothetical protein
MYIYTRTETPTIQKILGIYLSESFVVGGHRQLQESTKVHLELKAKLNLTESQG